MITFAYKGKWMAIKPTRVFYKSELKEVWKGSGSLSSGVYIIYDRNGEPLYVGWARYISERIREHMNGNSNTKHFTDEMNRVEVIAESDVLDVTDRIEKHLDINFHDIEGFFMEVLKPKYNKRKIHAGITPPGIKYYGDLDRATSEFEL